VKGLSAGVKVGITALVIAAIAYLSFKFVGKGIKGEEGYEVWALFHDATGLVDKSRVQVAGLTIGEIKDRRLQGTYARVDIKIKPDAVLWSNAAIFKKSASLLGEFYLEIDPGTPESIDPVTRKPVANYQLKDCYDVTHKENCNQITSVIEAVTTTDVLTQVTETLPVLRDILKDIQRLTQGPLQDIAREVQGGIAKNAEAAERLLNHIDQIAVDVKGITGGKDAEELRESMKNIREITESVKKLLGAGEGQVNTTADKLKQQLDTLAITLDKVNHSLDNVSDVTDKVAKGEGTVGRLLTDPTIADNVTDITDDASSFIKSITRLQTIVGIREEYAVLNNDFKTYISLRLMPRPDKYYLIELVDDPRGSRTYSHTYQNTNGAVTNTDTWNRSPAFKVSFMFAKRVEFLEGKIGVTGRLGIKESTGGLGLDVDFWGQRLTLTIDVFDFGSNPLPRLKAWFALEFIKHVWLVAGGDDLLNENGVNLRPGPMVTCDGNISPTSWCKGGRDVFAGLMLTFNDEDLRALLTVGGSALSGVAR
jgi:phospholipid/cholesterol/gamma-HCH transport system substrate-binding protein